MWECDCKVKAWLLRIICIGVVASCLWILSSSTTASTHPMIFDARIAARMSSIFQKRLPVQWSWKQIRPQEQKMYLKHFSTPLSLGVYTSLVVNQHRSLWCGCCYIISALQMLQDRTHIWIGKHSSESMMPYVEFDAQVALNKYDAHRRKTLHQPWNACRGGDPLHVLSAIEHNLVPLIIVESDGYAWMGHPVLDHENYKENHGIRVKESRKVDMSVDAVKTEIFEHGPVVLGINAQYMKLADAHGYLPVDVEVKERNHAVTVVGWKVKNNVEYWILRNSWGAREVPEDKPSDVTCVGVGENKCKVSMQLWKNDPSNPGYVYAPTQHAHFFVEPSPWFAADIVVDAKQKK